MAYSPMGSWGAEIERIRAGGLASSTEDRLARLRKWGGFTSFLTPRGLGVGADCGIEPIGQVVGLSTGLRLEGWVRTTQPGQGRPRPGAPRWRERTGPSGPGTPSGGKRSTASRSKPSCWARTRSWP